MTVFTAGTQGKQDLKSRKIRSEVSVKKWSNKEVREVNDFVANEAPLEIHVAHGPLNNRVKELLSVTMRTPGDDFNLVTGFLYAEHLIRRAADVISIRFTGNFKEESLQENAVLVELHPEVKFDSSTRRQFLSGSACGFCGRGSFDAAASEGVLIPFSAGKKVADQVLFKLPGQLQSYQGLFSETGGSHAVALLDFEGNLVKVFEDVGRHNAMDKLIGSMLKRAAIPLSERIALFSGRLSYELVQKALAAGIPVVCSLGAPTSLAVGLAADFGMTVVGFLKSDRMNVYCGEERIFVESES